MSVFALLVRLAPHIEKEVNLVVNSKQEAETLSLKLKKIQVGLQDAERKGVTEASIKDWLKELEDVVYEMDDVLDEWEMVNLQLKVEGSEDSSDPWEKVRSFVISFCSCIKHVVGRRELTKKMKNLSVRLDKILEEKGKYSFVPGESNRGQEFKHEESISVVDEEHVQGRKSDKESLVRKLVPEGEENDDNNNGTQIVSIVGIGGVGKTTLAQLAYNHREVDGHFQLKAWVSVSDPFDASTVARAILEAFGKSSADAHKLETLGQHLKEAVKNKRFLLVLDDVWTEDRTKWQNLKNCLHGAPGSRILVTTRNEMVARMMGTAHLHRLGLLSDIDCGTILNGIALDGRRREDCEKLRDIGTEIAKRCNGLPLAARTMGSMLALRFTEQEWQDVLESPLWKYEDEVSDLFRLLKLSYIDLSPLLKHCFLSSIVYPKGSLIYFDQLIRIWMAYGYLDSSGSVDEVKLKGLKYFRELAMRSFFQKLENDEYAMHDIMYDFANYLSGSEYSFIIDGDLEKVKSLPYGRAHYNMALLNSLGKIRTFCARYISQEELPLNLFGHLKSVRLLSIIECNLQELPQEVGELIHLRYLDLSGNPIQELPETLSELHNLQTLGLENCSQLSRLPEGIGNLINLRHILNGGADNLDKFPRGIEKLIGLWTLSEFRSSKLENLENLNQLQGSLCIFLHKLNDTASDSLEQVRKANLKSKNQIQKMELFFQDEELTDDIVEALQPPPNLQTLATHCTSAKWLSNWIETSTSFDNLKVVEFDGCDICSELPPFGKLPNLEKFLIRQCSFKCLGMEFLGIKGSVSKAQPSSRAVGWFPRLKKLHFDMCNLWEEWEDIREEEAQDLVPVMPCLEELRIVDCQMLRALPHTILRQTTSLQLFAFSGNEILYWRYHEHFGEDWDKISHIPHVEIVRDSYRVKLRIALLVSKAAMAFVRLRGQKSSSWVD